MIKRRNHLQLCLSFLIFIFLGDFCLCEETENAEEPRFSQAASMLIKNQIILSRFYNEYEMEQGHKYAKLILEQYENRYGKDSTLVGVWIVISTQHRLGDSKAKLSNSKMLERASQILKSEPDFWDYAVIAFRNLAKLHSEDYFLGLSISASHLKDAVDILKQQKEPDIALYMEILIDFHSVSKGKPDKQLAIRERFESLLQKRLKFEEISDQQIIEYRLNFASDLLETNDKEYGNKYLANLYEKTTKLPQEKVENQLLLAIVCELNASLYTKNKEFDKAIEFEEKAFGLFKSSSGPNDISTAQVAEKVAKLYLFTQQNAKAMQWFEISFDSYAADMDTYTEYRLEALQELLSKSIIAYLRSGRGIRKHREMTFKLTELYVDYYGANDEKAIDRLGDFGREVSTDDKNWRGFASLAEKILETRKLDLNEKSLRYTELLSKFRRIYRDEPQKDLNALKEIYEIRSRILGADHPTVRNYDLATLSLNLKVSNRQENLKTLSKVWKHYEGDAEKMESARRVAKTGYEYHSNLHEYKDALFWMKRSMALDAKLPINFINPRAPIGTITRNPVHRGVIGNKIFDDARGVRLTYLSGDYDMIPEAIDQYWKRFLIVSGYNKENAHRFKKDGRITAINMYRAKYYLANGDYDKAFKFIEEPLQRINALSLSQLAGDIFRAKGDYQTASEYYSKHFDEVKDLSSETLKNYSSSYQKHNLLKLLAVTALLNEDQEKYELCLKEYRAVCLKRYGKASTHAIDELTAKAAKKMENKKWEQAEILLIQTVNLTESSELQDKEGLENLYSKLSETLIQLNRKKEAKAWQKVKTYLLN